MKIFLLGDKGQLGTILKRELSKNHEIIIFPDKISQENISNIFIMLQKCDIVINSAAISNTRICETEYNKTLFINAQLPIEIARFLSLYRPNVHFIDISTGCIFDGNLEPHYEDSKPTPWIAYSRQKLMAESIQWIYTNTLILRPRMIFSELDMPSNLLKKVKGFRHFLSEKNSMTCAWDILSFIEIAIEKKLRGIFNFCNKGMSSPFEIKMMMQDIVNWHYPIFQVSKQNLRKELNLRLTDTWIESHSLHHYYEMPMVEDRLKQMVELSKTWLTPNSIEEIKQTV